MSFSTVTGNHFADRAGCDNVGAVYIVEGSSSLDHCTISGDYGAHGSALRVVESEPEISDGITGGNTPASARVLDVPAEFSTLAAALDAACERDTILLAPGRYPISRLILPQLGVVVRGWEPLDPDVVAATVLEGDGVNEVVSYSAQLRRRSERLRRAARGCWRRCVGRVGC
jgi:hypothetical protein